MNKTQAASYDILVDGTDIAPEEKDRIKEISVTDYLRLPDVCAIEFDDVDVNERDVGAVFLHAVACRQRELFEVLRKTSGGQHASVRIALALRDRRKFIEKRSKDCFFVGKVVIDIARRRAGVVSNFANGGRAISLM